MKILALDIGTKRIGIAKASTVLSIAMPLTLINRSESDSDLDIIKKIKKIIEENTIDEILLGLPVTLSGKEEHFAKYVRKFGNLIETELKINIVYWDERLSSVSAEKILTQGRVSRKKRKENVDKIAATIFLQNYLDFLGRNK